MRFLRPNPGECADRQTILHLKIKYGSAVGEQTVSDRIIQGGNLDAGEDTVVKTTMDNKAPVNTEPFLMENEEIQQYLENNYFPDIAAFGEKQSKFDEYMNQLADVNEDLWKLEDQARILRSAPKEDELVIKRKAEVLDAITNLNDQRANIVKQINSLWNIYAQEKLHK